MLSVLMNLTHNNGPGCSAVLGADGLQTVIGLIDALLGPPEEEADFVRIADRCSPAIACSDSQFFFACRGRQYGYSLNHAWRGRILSLLCIFWASWHAGGDFWRGWI